MTFDRAGRLQPGQIVSGQISAHRYWGIEVTMDGGDEGTVDILFMDDDPSKCHPIEWPAVGTHVKVVVQTYMPDGQLRLSLRQTDIVSGNKGAV